MKDLFRQVVGFCRDHPVCWVPLLISAGIAVALNAASKYGRHLILEWTNTGRSVLGGAAPLAQNADGTPRAAFAATIFGSAINLAAVLVMTIAFVAMARMAERVLAGDKPSAAELINALMEQFRGIAWFSLQYSVFLFGATLIGSLLFLLPDFARLYGITIFKTKPTTWIALLAEVMAVSYMLAVPALRLVSRGEMTSEPAELESKARELGLWYAFSGTALAWCWEAVQLNVHFAPAVSTAAEYVRYVVVNVPLLMLAVSFVMIAAPAPDEEPSELSPVS